MSILFVLLSVHFRLAFLRFLLEIFIDKQHKAVGQSTKTKATQASLLGWLHVTYLQHHAIDHVALKVS